MAKTSGRKRGGTRGAARKAARPGAARTGAGRKTAAPKASARRTRARKGAGRTRPAAGRTRSAGARKPGSGKPAARKTAARKTAARKTAARKVAARKTSARRPAPRRISSRRTSARPTPRTTLTAATETVGRAARAAVGAVARLTPWAEKPADAISLLEQDHRRLETLLAEGEDTTERAVARRTELLNTITAELQVHEQIEEKLFYPALRAHPEAKDIVLEGYQEHHVVDLIVSELHAMGRGDERWGAKFKVLKENIEHHIEEEEGEMFRTARSVMSKAELEDLGARMQAMKADASSNL